MNETTENETPREDEKLTLATLWRDMVAPTAARLALLACAKQFHSEGCTRDEFIEAASRCFDSLANVSADASEPKASDETTEVAI